MVLSDRCHTDEHALLYESLRLSNTVRGVLSAPVKEPQRMAVGAEDIIEGALTGHLRRAEYAVFLAPQICRLQDT